MLRNAETIPAIAMGATNRRAISGDGSRRIDKRLYKHSYSRGVKRCIESCGARSRDQGQWRVDQNQSAANRTIYGELRDARITGSRMIEQNAKLGQGYNRQVGTSIAIEITHSNACTDTALIQWREHRAAPEPSLRKRPLLLRRRLMLLETPKP